MGFPIAVGTGPRHSCSRPFPHIFRSHKNENGEKEGDRSEVQGDEDVIMAMGTNDDEALTATVFICYHFLAITSAAGSAAKGNYDKEVQQTKSDLSKEEVGKYESIQETLQENRVTQFNVVAELSVQITPTTSPFVSTMDAMSIRETKSRVPLGVMQKRRRQVPYVPNASIEFSSNETHLACLIPLPVSYELVPSSVHDIYSLHGENEPISTIVIFRIQTQKLAPEQQLQQLKQHILPRLPDYIVEKSINGDRPNEDLENVNIHATKREDNLGTNELSQEKPISITKKSSSRGNSVSYVAHEPKIVRAPQALSEPLVDSANENKALPNRSFLRKLSGGVKTTSPTQPPPIQCAACMCNFPFDHYRGKSASAFSLLLVGTAHGRLILVDFSIARVCLVALEPFTTNNGHVVKTTDGPIEQSGFTMRRSYSRQQFIPNEYGSNHLCSGSVCNPIVHLSQCSPSNWKPLDIYGEEQGSLSKGRIATVFRDGSVQIFTTSFVPVGLHSGRLNGADNWTESAIYSPIDVDLRGRNNGPKYTGLEMCIQLLSSFHSSKFNYDASNLHYIRAKWLNPIILVLLTRSSCLDEDFLCRRNNSTLVLPSEMVVAQVWTVAEVMGKNGSTQTMDEYAGWQNSSDVDANIALVSELKMPCGDNLDELVDDTFYLSQKACLDLDKPDALIFTECARGMSILYHQGIDSLAINSQAVVCTSASTGVTTLKVRPFCLLWDWKSNVPGLTLASSTSYSLQSLPSLFSWFQLGEDDYYGLCAVHVYEQTYSRKMCRAGKDVFSLGTLSPLNRFAAEECLCSNEPSALLLHGDSVTFPFLSRTTNMHGVTLDWEESRVPPTYVASNGPCRIAAIGKDYGRSIAVAACRGLCVLDMTRMPWLESQHTGPEENALSTSSFPQSPRWRQFSNVNDEQRFRVVSMIWWERSNEDLLLATVQFMSYDKLHLVCWSRKGVGFGDNQLLRESPTHATVENGVVSDIGLVLPHFFRRAHSMSIIVDPTDRKPCGQSYSSNRALLLLAYASCSDGTSSCMNYVVYQLQASSPNGKYEIVLARNASCGRIPLQIGKSPDLYAVESVTGVFLAGGSFLYDLDDKEMDDPDVHDIIAVIGITTIFQGLVGVCVTQTGHVLYRPSLIANESIDKCQIGCGEGLIVMYWVSGTISNKDDCRVAWSIAKNDGKVYCWSVPCRNFESSHRFSVELTNADHCAIVLPGLERHSILGDVCHLGCSSLWMNGAMTSEREVALGPFCPLSFGCTLYAGQRSRKNRSHYDPWAMNSFHVSKCTVAPPQFTPLLYISFWGISSTLINNESGLQLVSSKGQDNGSYHEFARDHIKSTLQQVQGFGSSSSSLRVITLKVIELLNDSKVFGDICLISENKDSVCEATAFRLQKWKMGKAILHEIVSVAREIYDALGFATFFLSIGRQIEPYQFNLIFPLPEIAAMPNSPSFTAEDLFSISCERGSLLTALSALPLFSCHIESQSSVAKLIYHCLIKIEENFLSFSSYSELTCGEEEIFLHQLFWFGVKLEDAIEIENAFEKEHVVVCMSESKNCKHSFTSSQNSIRSSSNPVSSIDQDTGDFVSITSSIQDCIADDYYRFDTSSEETHKLRILPPCRKPRKEQAGFVEKVVTKLFPSIDSPENLRIEDAIHEAASSFILSGFEDLSINSSVCTPLPVVCPKNEVTGEIEPVIDKPSNSEEANAPGVVDVSPREVHITVAGAVSLFIGHAIVSGGSFHKNDLHGWKAVSTIAHILQGDRKTTAITCATSKTAQSICHTMTIKDFIPVATTFSHLEHLKEEHVCKNIVVLLSDLTFDCHRQIHSGAFDSVFNLILLLLLRYDACRDVQLCRATLVLVGIVCGHLSGRISELIDLSETHCDVNAIYSQYAAKLDA